ncbi:hypothetical protein M8818_000440 [Zalaria obscura]|uniref:Uncharacterized protein n=1 Tax=Zalaria obscura TaxID=2024903 RepID=A0ACC3SNB2_9PEZI
MPNPGSYVPPPSIGHEIGIMFGFLAAMALAMTLYGIAWNIGNKRSARKEAERIEALKASGWLKEKQGMDVERIEDEKTGNEIVL